MLRSSPGSISGVNGDLPIDLLGAKAQLAGCPPSLEWIKSFQQVKGRKGQEGWGEIIPWVRTPCPWVPMGISLTQSLKSLWEYKVWSMLFKIHLGSVKSTYLAERQTQRSGFFSNLQQLQSSLLLPKILYARRREQGSESPRLLPGHTRDTWQGPRWPGSSHRESCVNRAKLEDLMNENGEALWGQGQEEQ